MSTLHTPSMPCKSASSLSPDARGGGVVGRADWVCIVSSSRCLRRWDGGQQLNFPVVSNLRCPQKVGSLCTPPELASPQHPDAQVGGVVHSSRDSRRETLAVNASDPPRQPARDTHEEAQVGRAARYFPSGSRDACQRADPAQPPHERPTRFKMSESKMSESQNSSGMGLTIGQPRRSRSPNPPRGQQSASEGAAILNHKTDGSQNTSYSSRHNRPRPEPFTPTSCCHPPSPDLTPAPSTRTSTKSAPDRFQNTTHNSRHNHSRPGANVSYPTSAKSKLASLGLDPLVAHPNREGGQATSTMTWRNSMVFHTRRLDPLRVAEHARWPGGLRWCLPGRECCRSSSAAGGSSMS